MTTVHLVFSEISTLNTSVIVTPSTDSSFFSEEEETSDSAVFSTSSANLASALIVWVLTISSEGTSMSWMTLTSKSEVTLA